MRTPHTLRVLLPLLFAVAVPRLPAPAQEAAKEFTVEDIYASRKFTAAGFRNMRWIEGGRAMAFLETDSATGSTDIRRYDVATGGITVLVPGADLRLPGMDTALAIQNYAFSPDGGSVLFTGTISARSLKTGGNFHLYRFADRSFRRLTDTDAPQVNVKFSPDSRRIGFVRSQDLYVVDLESGAETRLTFDGSATVRNGNFDWVYEEEFGIIDGWRWSPDGRWIAFWQLDEGRVPTFPIVDFLPLHQQVSTMRYPKAGDPNSIVRIGVVAAPAAGGGTNGRTPPAVRWLDLGAPADSTQDIYVPRIAWTKLPGLLTVQTLNRLQNHLELLLFDLNTGERRTVLTESSDTWVDVHDDLTFLDEGDRFLWASDREGYRHLAVHDLRGNLVTRVTTGEWEVDDVAGVDEENGLVYFTAGVASPLERDLYAARLDGSGMRKLSEERGTHAANFAPDFSVYRHTWSDANTPPRTVLRRADGSLLRVVSDGAIPALAEYPISPKTFFTFTTTDGVELNGWTIRPHDFDPARRYPVLMHVYGGPGSQTVRNSWGGNDYLWYQMLARKGYVLAGVDNRGTGARGRQFRSVVYRNLGRWETHDQIEAARHLASLPWVDGSRIGIWGWSYGGYMALMAAALGDATFRAAVSVAPVTSWKFYDTIYTERYMQTPELNPEGYRESAPIEHAGALDARLLIVHGTADDNVHWQNTVTMVHELIKAGKQFETAFYPEGRHGIGSGRTRAQLFTKITSFLLGNL